MHRTFHSKRRRLVSTIMPSWLSLLCLVCCGQSSPGQSRSRVEGVLLSNDAWPRAAGLAEWTSDVMRIAGVDQATETAQAKAFFEWLRLFSRMAVGGMIQAYEGPHGREAYVLDAHKQLFVYGWGYCDTTSRIAEAAWQEWKRDAKAAERVCVQHDDGGYHTMFRLRLDGRFGAFDPRYGYYLIERDSPDARILDWAELNGKFEVNRSYKNRSRPYFEIAGTEWQRALLLHPAYFESEAAWRAAGAAKEHVFGDGAYRLGTPLHDMTFELKRGTTIERFWGNSAHKFYVPAGQQTKREWPFLPSGRFYRVTETSHQGNWPQHDPNYRRARAYLSTVPVNENYPPEVAGGRTIGQAYGVLEYSPQFADGSMQDSIVPGATLVTSTSAPFLRPVRQQDAGEAVFDVRCPYVLVDGTLSTTLSGEGTEIAIRTLAPKPVNESAPDEWSSWQTLASGEGTQQIELGKPRFNGRDNSIHGAYRFQLRVKVPPAPARKAAAGLSSLKLKLYFENGIMSIPPLFAGRNTMRLRLTDPERLTAPITVVYHYETAGGARVFRRQLHRSDFTNGEAVFQADAPGLIRCRSVAVVY